MNIKNKTRAVLAAAAALVAGAAILNLNGLTLFSTQRGVSVNCVSTLTLPELPNGGRYNGSLILQLQKDNTGVLGFTGVLTTKPEADSHPGHPLIVQRAIRFNYKVASNGALLLTVQAMSKYHIDNVPDDIFSRNVYDMSQDEKHAQIYKLRNGYLIGNMYSPTNICVSKSEYSH